MIDRRSFALAMALASAVVISPSAPLARAQVVVPLSIRRFDPDAWITLRDFRYVTSVATSGNASMC